MLKPRTAAVTATAVLALAGCSQGSNTEGPEPGSYITGKQWRIESVTSGGKILRAPAASRLTVGAYGRTQFTDGCNHFRTDMKFKAVSLDFTAGKITRTTAADCDAKTGMFEQALTETLGGKMVAAPDRDRLTLTNPRGGNVVLNGFPPKPPVPLLLTKWTVTALTSGDTASTLPKGTEGSAYFTVGSDDSISGKLGCNRLSGTAKPAASTLTFGRMSTTRMMCGPRAMELERQLLKVLSGKVSYAIDSIGITLTGPDGRGLQAAGSGT
ncbi:META domain-containing protein [Streptomyces sp. NBC_01465]|uniref:META domain-containing protein n=1 Tax=Streptomyces sp. NBC_01465 TaxID=2903878 RepID=UPI002E36AF19|nr:META domain-containing protein [Streptomyces sp. NBC_01465]